MPNTKLFRGRTITFFRIQIFVINRSFERRVRATNKKFLKIKSGRSLSKKSWFVKLIPTFLVLIAASYLNFCKPEINFRRCRMAIFTHPTKGFAFSKVALKALKDPGLKTFVLLKVKEYLNGNRKANCRKC